VAYEPRSDNPDGPSRAARSRIRGTALRSGADAAPTGRPSGGTSRDTMGRRRSGRCSLGATMG